MVTEIARQIFMEKQQILIVDDEAINREILKSMFGEYERLEAENGKQAVEKIAASRNLVLILLDVSMPVMSGFGVLEFMHERGLMDKIPVILITGKLSLTAKTGRIHMVPRMSYISLFIRIS